MLHKSNFQHPAIWQEANPGQLETFAAAGRRWSPDHDSVKCSIVSLYMSIVIYDFMILPCFCCGLHFCFFWPNSVQGDRNRAIRVQQEPLRFYEEAQLQPLESVGGGKNGSNSCSQKIVTFICHVS